LTRSNALVGAEAAQSRVQRVDRGARAVTRLRLQQRGAVLRRVLHALRLAGEVHQPHQLVLVAAGAAALPGRLEHGVDKGGLGALLDLRGQHQRHGGRRLKRTHLLRGVAAALRGGDGFGVLGAAGVGDGRLLGREVGNGLAGLVVDDGLVLRHAHVAAAAAQALQRHLPEQDGTRDVEQHAHRGRHRCVDGVVQRGAVGGAGDAGGLADEAGGVAKARSLEVARRGTGDAHGIGELAVAGQCIHGSHHALPIEFDLDGVSGGQAAIGAAELRRAGRARRVDQVGRHLCMHAATCGCLAGQCGAQGEAGQLHLQPTVGQAREGHRDAVVEQASRSRHGH
jgi:hypothetical protein